MKFERPSRVQAETLPMILTPPFRNLVAQAHNGSGKTTCFALALLGRVDANIAQPQCLCMCPTRELVVQNMQVSISVHWYTLRPRCHLATHLSAGTCRGGRCRASAPSCSTLAPLVTRAGPEFKEHAGPGGYPRLLPRSEILYEDHPRLCLKISSSLGEGVFLTWGEGGGGGVPADPDLACWHGSCSG